MNQQQLINKEQLEYFLKLCEEEKQIRSNFQKFIESRLYIKTKKAIITSLKFNNVQKYLASFIKRNEKEKILHRYIVLKARQLGISTFIEAFLFYKTITQANVNTLIVAHKSDASRYLFEISKLFYDKLNERYKPTIKYSTKYELLFENPNQFEKEINPGLRSRFIVSTAANTTGRSYTIHLLHASEVAMWENPEDTYISLMQAVPDTHESVVFLESTAAGRNFFYELWTQAVEGENNYIPIFCAWWMHEEYRHKITDEFYDIPLSDYEKWLKRELKLTDEQLYWRRLCIKNKCLGDEEIFAIEYPATPEEAFTIIGKTFFPKKQLKFLLMNIVYNPEIGEIQDNQFIPNKYSNLKIWKKPEPNKQYVIGADPSLGISESFSCIEVVNREDFEQVAEWHGKIDPDLLAYEIAKIATYYNNALVGVEVNPGGGGLVTLNTLKNIYWNLYYWQRFDEYGYPVTKKLGWETNTHTKPLMLEYMKACIRDGFKIYSKELIDECLSFMYTPGFYDMTTAEGTDDRVMAMAIALQMHEKTPFVKEEFTTLTEETIHKDYITKDDISYTEQTSIENIVTQYMGKW
jgi:hypothetical protein